MNQTQVQKCAFSLSPQLERGHSTHTHTHTHTSVCLQPNHNPLACCGDRKQSTMPQSASYCITEQSIHAHTQTTTTLFITPIDNYVHHHRVRNVFMILGVYPKMYVIIK